MTLSTTHSIASTFYGANMILPMSKAISKNFENDRKYPHAL